MGVNILMKKLLAVISVCIFASFAFPRRQTYAVETAKNDSLNYTQHELVAGDVNADGELSISDVVLMQRWLLSVPDTELADWKAGDLCEDDGLDVFDLCLMKRALIQTITHNPLDSLIGMDYEDAVQNNYISNSEYNYQISGNLKS